MIHYPVLQEWLPIYQGQYSKMPVSYLLATEVLSLPIWPKINLSSLWTVVYFLKQIIGNNQV